MSQCVWFCIIQLNSNNNYMMKNLTYQLLASLWEQSKLVGVKGSFIVVSVVATIDIILPGQVVSTDILVAQRLSMQAILGLNFFGEEPVSDY